MLEKSHVHKHGFGYRQLYLKHILFHVLDKFDLMEPKRHMPKTEQHEVRPYLILILVSRILFVSI